MKAFFGNIYANIITDKFSVAKADTHKLLVGYQYA